ncbi:ComEC/Rec2 family competence protein [Hyphococcus sp.]|uniref:ComEC/Rec2 family competence protein n=1 Tax=Hyphococcus sp. TaxID=2038636 RepID=UPI003CCBC404
MTAEPVATSAAAGASRSGFLSPAVMRRLYLIQETASKWAARDLARLSLWMPVAVAIGAGLYFGLKSEPTWYAGPMLLAVSGAIVIFAPGKRRFTFALVFAAIGFTAADYRTAHVAAPQLWRDLGIVQATGRLISVEESAEQRRYILALQSIEGIAAEELPARARISWRGEEFEASPGDTISVRAGLSPPPPPVAPDAFDYARQLYFKRIGAVGFAVTPPEVINSSEKSARQRFAASIETLRFSLFKRITAEAPSKGGAIIAAIVTGKRDAISEDSENALRDAGLAHLLAISGLHMGLATGLIFLVARFGLAAIEPLALRYPIKKWAALAALASGFFYLVLSGGGWSARRAFLMAGIMFVAILVDRRALSLRNVAIAAIVILVTTPEALFHPGFQMSFAAVTALIAAYEWFASRSKPDRDFSWGARIRRYTVGLAVTDTIAALATAPFALYHFNRVAIYSLPANITAMPLMGVWIVPSAIIALALSPFGLDGWAWRASAAGMDVILFIAVNVSSWPGAVSVTAQWPQHAMLFLAIGGLWLCLSRAPWRLAGLAAIPLAAIAVNMQEYPHLFVTASGRNAAVITKGAEPGDAQLAAFNTRREKFAIGILKETVGFDPEESPTASLEDVYACDGSGCVGAFGDTQKKIAAFTQDSSTLAEDCNRADLVVAFFPVTAEDWRACRAYLIDRRSVWLRGAHAVRIDKHGEMIVANAAEFRGARPWTGN